MATRVIAVPRDKRPALRDNGSMDGMRAVVVAASLLVCATTLTAGCATRRDGEAGGGAVELGWHVPGAPDAAGVPDDVRAMAGPFADTMAVV